MDGAHGGDSDLSHPWHGGVGRRGARRGRVLALVACLALAGGLAVALLGLAGDGDEPAEVVVLPEPEQGTLALAAPTDGRASMGLPVAVAPASELTDFQSVDATGEGFEPGEAAGVVQCAVEAAQPDRGGEAAGVDACDISPFTSVNADDDGVVRGSYQVQRVLTTPWTGTIDCAERPGRCIVAIGALSDHDRSGMAPIDLATGGLAPLAIPSLSVSPADGLADGQAVQLKGAGFPAGAFVTLELCSLDPASCWTVGEQQAEPDPAEADAGIASTPHAGFVGAIADETGSFAVVTEVWRFFPGPGIGTYVDCALSPCAIRATAQVDVNTAATVGPPPARLAFAGGEGPPTAPTLDVAPAQGVATGDEVTISGSGFIPGSPVSLFHCATSATGEQACSGLGSGPFGSYEPMEVGDDGTFVLSAQLPPLSTWTATECDEDGRCQEEVEQPIDCSGDAWTCDIRVDGGGPMTGRPTFSPASVVLGFR